MESAHQHYQQFQDHQLLPPIVAVSSSSSSSSSSPSSSYGVSTSNYSSVHHTWAPNNTTLSRGSTGSLSSLLLYPNNNNNNNINLTARNHQNQLNNNICNSSSSSMTQDLTFHHWANAPAFIGGGSQSIKQELSSSECYPRFISGGGQVLMKAPSPTIAAAIDLEIDDHHHHHQTLSGGHHQPPAPDPQFCSSSNINSNRGRFSQIYPTVNVPSLNDQQEASLLGNSCSSSSLGMNMNMNMNMNMQALDLLNSESRLSGGFSHTSLPPPPEHHHQHLGIGFPNYGITAHHLHQSTHQRSFGNSFGNVSAALLSNATEAKRSCNVMEPKPPQAPPKKSRLDLRASCPPFKVRKEKLGDRIAALQQLVAPFGKTDTASVLMEAIGYINFLQNQVETLSVPYMKSSRNKSSRAMQVGGQEANIIGSEEERRDLRSRGLCLVPLSCLSYVTDSGGGVWPPPPNFGGS